LKVRENEEMRQRILDALKWESRPYKPKNWHVSKLVCCRRAAYYWRKGERSIPPDVDSLTLTFARGRAHHEVLEVFDVKEKRFVLDEVIGHIDMIGDRVCEIFTTVVGLNRVEVPEDATRVFTIKVCQLMCYLKAEEQTSGDLIIFYLFGDYSRPIKPELKVYTFEWEKKEIDLHWNYRLGVGAQIDELIELDTPPTEVGEDYECTNCGYRRFCSDVLTPREFTDVILR